MLKPGLKIFFLSLIGVLPGIDTSSQDAETLVNQVKEKLAKVQDYKAKAILKTDVPFIRMPQSEVDVYYKKPDKFKIKKEGGVSVLPKGGLSVNINSMLGSGKYTAVPAGETSFAGITVKVIKLLPLDENSETVLTTLYIDEKNLLVRKATTTTRDNGTYEVEMEYGKFANWGLPDKVVFIFNTKGYQLPKGVTLEYDPGTKPPANTAKNKEQKGKIEIRYSNYDINKGMSDDIFKATN
jgi:outer membrane lipoprotein-sorting protein